MSKIQFGVLATLLGLLIVLQAAPMVMPKDAPPPPKAEKKSDLPRYEYRIDGFPDSVFTERLGAAGAEGWDLASARRAVSDREGIYEVILKRPLIGDAKPQAMPAETGKSVVRTDDPGTGGGDASAALAKMTSFTDAMCACSDAACARKVNEDMLTWSKANPPTSKAPMSEADTKKATEIGTRMSECMRKATGAN